MVEGYLALVEDHVLMDIQHQTVKTLEFTLPVSEAHESVAEDDVCCDSVLADQVEGVGCPGFDIGGFECCHPGLVDQAVEGYNVFVAVLSEELGELIV